jgi:hypothetical protein
LGSSFGPGFFLLLALRLVRVLHPWLAGNRTATHRTACITKLTRHCDGSGPFSSLSPVTMHLRHVLNDVG